MNDNQRRRLAIKARKVGWCVLHELSTVVTPVMFPAWHRRLLTQEYDGSKPRSLDCPHTRDEIQHLIVRMATENRDGGYRRIQGALANLAHEVSCSTVDRILKEHGMEPAPDRNRKTTGKEFLARQGKLIGAADSIHHQGLGPEGLGKIRGDVSDGFIDPSGC